MTGTPLRKRRVGLQSDEVRGIVEEMLVRLSAEPVATDENERDATRVDCLLDLLNEVCPWRYGIHVHEHPFSPESLRQAIMQRARLTTGLAAPIADEDALGPEMSIRAVSHFASSHCAQVGKECASRVVVIGRPKRRLSRPSPCCCGGLRLRRGLPGNVQQTAGEVCHSPLHLAPPDYSDATISDARVACQGQPDPSSEPRSDAPSSRWTRRLLSRPCRKGVRAQPLDAAACRVELALLSSPFGCETQWPERPQRLAAGTP